MVASTDPDQEEKSELLCERFEEGIKDGFGAVLILYSIHNRDKAYSQEIKTDLQNIMARALEYNYTSFYRLLNRLRDEFKLIVESSRQKSGGPDRVYYSLTPLGKIVLEKVLSRYIQPLKQMHLDEK